MTREDSLAKLRERIVAFAASRLSRDMAEDLVQDVMIILHEKYPQVTDITELVPLSFQILRFKMRDFQRKSHRRGQYNQESIEDLPLADPHDDPAMLWKKNRPWNDSSPRLRSWGLAAANSSASSWKGIRSLKSGSSWDSVPSIPSIPGTIAAERNCWH